MALGDDYVTRDELKSYMALEGDAQDDLVDGAISSASREIEKHCHRQFNDAGTASPRFYYPANSGVVIVDDFWSLDGFKVEVDGVELGADATELQPLNRMLHGSPWVYWRLHGTFDPSVRVKVTARWGWEAVPADVRQACLMLASDTFQVKDARLGVAGTDHFGNIIRIRGNTLVEQKLKHYTRQKVLVR